MVIARMLGQQESLPLSGEETQVSLPQQDQALVGHNPSPHNLLLPEVESERPSPDLHWI